MKNLISILIIFGLISCQKENLRSSTDSSISSEINAKIDTEEEMVLGKKLSIPYAISNVEKAQDDLEAKNKRYKKVKIKENYHYVRLLPKNMDEYDLINTDSTIHTFEHPLDFEILKFGNKYKDKTLSDTDLSYIYCVIPVDKKFKNIELNVLEKLYIPFGSGGKDPESKRLERLEDENLKLLDDEILESTGFKQKANKAKIVDWYPSGYIKVAEYNSTYSGFVPVQGCKVRTTKALVVTHSAITNTEGFYYINNSYWDNTEVNYDIKWERDDFDIRDGAYGQAYTNGPKQKGSWNPNILSSETSFLYAWVNNAANYYYYYSGIMGIQSPPSHTPRPAFHGIAGILLPQKMKLGVSMAGRAHYFDFNTGWLAAQVAIKLDNNKSTENIFATTCHELAHASHWSLGYTTSDYLFDANFNRKLAESWAQCVGWFATAKYFSSSRFTNYNSYVYPQNLTYDVMPSESRQSFYLSIWRTTSNNSYYTSAFIDLIDNYNQPNCTESAYNYSLNQLEKTIAKCPKNWDSYRDKLNSEYPSHVAKDQMLYIFNNYKQP